LHWLFVVVCEGGRVATTLEPPARSITPLSNVARLLLENCADINARTKYHSTPLHLAARRGWAEVVHVLLQHGANVVLEDSGGRTALQVASNEGHNEIVKLLSEYVTG
jgi:ankyrin repeat protein